MFFSPASRSRLAALAAILLLWGQAAPATAQRRNADPPLRLNPLERTVDDDPLVPSQPLDRDLTPLERRTLAEALERLDREARGHLAAGEKARAFEVWFRELRLQRVLGAEEEIAALSRVGGFAWQEEADFEVRWIEERLDAIALASKGEGAEIELERLQALAAAYRALRSPKTPALYEELLSRARTADDKRAEFLALGTLGQLHFDLLDYAEAAVAYEQMLDRLRQGFFFDSNTTPEAIEIELLARLVLSYRQIQQYELAIERRAEAIALHRKFPDLVAKIPNLHVAQGEDLERIGKDVAAASEYEDAYTLAWRLQHLAQADEALDLLAKLHQRAERYRTALEVYRALLQTRQRSLNVYGMMVAYDEIAEIYLALDEHALALQALQQGLEMAGRLKTREAYFRQRIQQVREKLS